MELLNIKPLKWFFKRQGKTVYRTSMFYENLVMEESVEFILHLGDITADGSEERLRDYQEMTMNSSVPVFSTPGNHDIKQFNSTDLYKSIFGNSEYYFKYGGYLFISLDSTKASFRALATSGRNHPENPRQA